MVRTVFKTGNSHAFRLDKTMMELLGIHEGSELNITYSGGSMIVTPVESTISEEGFKKASEASLREFEDIYRKLAE